LAAVSVTGGALVTTSIAAAATVPPTFVGATAGVGNAADATTYTIAIPAGVAPGDLLVAGLSTRGNPLITPPPGWTEVDATSKPNVMTLRTFLRRCSTDCAPGSRDVWGLSSPQGASGTVAAYRGVDAVVPLHRLSGQVNEWSRKSTAPSIITTLHDVTLVAVHTTNSAASYKAPSGMDGRVQAVDDAGMYRTSTGVSDEVFRTAGSTGVRVGSFSKSGTNIGVLLALVPSSAAIAAPVTTEPVTTEPSPSGSVVWRADGGGALEDDWGSLATATECSVVTKAGQTSERVSRLAGADSPSPVGRFYRAQVKPTDVCYGSRAELGQGNPVKPFSDGTGDRLFREGEDHWISFASRLAPNYPINASRWSLIFQWKQTAKYGGPDGNPILSMVAYNGKYRMWGPGFSELNQQNPPTGAYGSWEQDFATNPSLDQWHLFTMHVKWSPDPTKGYVELLGDLADGRGWRTLISGRNVATMKINDSGGNGETIPNHARAGIYRDERHATDTFLDVASYTVATTRQAAEATAFRPELRPGS
jgi:hypothetical protein